MTGDPDTIVVTGAAGFIGSHLCDRLLAEGRRVIGVDDLSTGRIANLAEARSYGKSFTFENLDVRAPELLALFERYRPAAVMHLAAQASVKVSIQDPLFDADVNILGTLNVLECAARTETAKVVFASSGGTIYGEPRRLPVKETALGGSHPLTAYGLGKKAAGEYVGLYQRFRGIDGTSLALANVYGPRQDPHGEAGAVAIFTQKMLAGEGPTIFGDGNQTRDFVFVSDVVDAFARALERPIGRLYNIGTGLETSVNHLYRMLGDITGFAGEPGYGPLPSGDLRRSALDSSLAEAELGWRPWTHLEDGLRETVAYLKGV
ncbi:MAG TPA: NAD-dependent epimerase/dehydratase family protein [Actinomycetota bacterium]|nr:NAD-dependent epimerase/dehydratase family protein [Actinomycetota bacterium]